MGLPLCHDPRRERRRGLLDQRDDVVWPRQERHVIARKRRDDRAGPFDHEPLRVRREQPIASEGVFRMTTPGPRISPASWSRQHRWSSGAQYPIEEFERIGV
jgi:hypothetical protein